jgi:hypothetical protein
MIPVPITERRGQRKHVALTGKRYKPAIKIAEGAVG